MHSLSPSLFLVTAGMLHRELRATIKLKSLDASLFDPSALTYFHLLQDCDQTAGRMHHGSTVIQRAAP